MEHFHPAPMAAANAVASGDHCKAFATMQARAALAGCTLHRLASGAYLLGRWNLSREFPNLREVSVVLDRIGGPA